MRAGSDALVRPRPLRCRLVTIAVCNSVVVHVGLCRGRGAWPGAFADALMPQPRDLADLRRAGNDAAPASGASPISPTSTSSASATASASRAAAPARAATTASGARSRRSNASDRERPVDVVLVSGDRHGCRPLVRVGRVPRPASQPYPGARGAPRCHSRQSRPQHRRPRQSGAPRPADESQPQACGSFRALSAFAAPAGGPRPHRRCRQGRHRADGSMSCGRELSRRCPDS